MRTADTGWRGARALVLGASGFLGRWTARRLARAGAEVTLAVRDVEALERLRGPWELRGACRRVDLATPGAAEALVSALRPQVVFNLAGYGVDRSERDAGLAEALNARLPEELARALSAQRDSAWPGLALVHTGSALEYGTLATHLGEDEEPQPTTLYGRTKLAGTRAVVAEVSRRGLPAIVARLFTVYGPGEHAGRLLPSLRGAAARGERVALSAGLQERDFTCAEDVAEGLVRLAGLPPARLPAPPIVNLASGRLSSVRAFAEAAAAVLAIPAERLDFGALASRTDDMRHLPVTVERLRALLSWVPSPAVREGIERAEAFERRLARSPDDPAPPAG